MALSIRLLGPPEVRLDREPVPRLRSDKALALLAYLVVESDRAHRRERLAGMLWPDYPESSARANLRRALTDLRQAIGDHRAAPPHLHATRETIRFNTDSDYWLDVDAFGDVAGDQEALERAIGLYRGGFLEGFSVGDAPYFEEWELLKREQLERQLAEKLHGLSTTYQRRGEYAHALRHARRLVEVEPWNEQSHRQLIQLLALSGQRSAALAQYESYRKLLAEDLGAEPDDETKALYEGIRDGTVAAPPYIAPQPDSPSPPAGAQPVFVARERELAQLDGCLDEALDGRGRVVFIVGEPGSGKSVLAQAFTRRAMDRYPDLVAVSGRCNAQSGVGDPYLPFLEILRMLAGDIETGWAGGAVSSQHARRLWALMPEAVQALANDGPELIDRLVPGAALMARARAGAPEQVARLAELLARRAAAGTGATNMRQTDLFEQATKVLRTLSRRHPLILVVDDLQWADAGSIGLLFHLGRRLAGSRILLVGAYRPGDVAAGRLAEGGGWGRHPLVPAINEFRRDLGDIQIDLAQAEGRQFVEALLDTEPNRLDGVFRETLHRHTGGHPLFTVELLRGLQERGGLTRDESGCWIAGPALDWETLPPRVEAVIAERIGGLPEAWQAMLVTASVEGEEFTAEAVARVQDMDDREIVQWLSGPLSWQHLVHAQGLQRSDGQRLSRYRFHHYLFQKFLYTTLDPVQRARLHEAMGSALEALHGEQAGELAVPLARHFQAAGMTAKAIAYLQQAGSRAVHLFAYDEAIAHYRRGIDLAAGLPDGLQRVQTELMLQLALGVPLLATRGFSDDALARTYGRARELTRDVEASPELFQALAGLKSYYNLRLELQVARQLSQDMLRVAQRLDDPGLGAMAHYQMSTTLLYMGDAQGFFEQREKMLALYDAERDGAVMVRRFGYEPYLMNLSHAAWAQWFLGYPERARRCAEEAVDLARALGHPFVLAFALHFAAMLDVYQREVTAARHHAEATIDVSRTHGLALWLSGGVCAMGWVLAQEGDLQEGIAQILRGRAMVQATGVELGTMQLLRQLAQAYHRAGMVSEGLAVTDEAQSLIEASGCRMDEPEIHRLRGELLLMRAETDPEAEDCVRLAERAFDKALQVARTQQAKSWELRATMSLCRLRKKQGRRDEARAALSEIYGWFNEGSDTPDLREARALLASLEARCA